ncbi:MAG TPA: aminopeptidase P family protein [Treponema sp.]|nr:aminopeptidase P family protein [Treponema sp.]
MHKSIQTLIKAIREEALDGWLFCNFAHRDTLTDTILGLDTHTVSTRSWYYLLLAEGLAVKIVHAMETDVLKSLPGEISVYTSQHELSSLLARFSGKRFAVLYDTDLTVLSTVSASHLALAVSCGIKQVSAARLIQRVNVFSEHDYESHEQAAKVLYRTISKVWAFITEQFKYKKTLYEGEVQDFMMAEISKAGMLTDNPPIVAAGINSANPHYSVPSEAAKNRGSVIKSDTIIQFDLWAKFPQGMYADISWVGFTGKKLDYEIEEMFLTLRKSRDLVVPAINEALDQNKEISGAELDIIVRKNLFSYVDPCYIRHRTGHGIDSNCHGSGVNLDSIEFPDSRPIIEGSCFSVEPGIYCESYGMRTEINIYIRNGRPIISGGPIQNIILTLQD